MGEPSPEPEATYALGTVTRLTGLSAHVLRAWERRYGAVQPLRTEGGTRRFRESDVARLRLLRAAVAAGHAIGSIARLGDDELRRLAATPEPPSGAPIAPLMAAVERLDAEELERQLGLQLAGLGPLRFATDVAGPLMREVGEAWAEGRLDIAAEHMASALVRSLLGGVLRRRSRSGSAPPVLFATPAEERHELGALISAVVAAEAGGNVTWLGSDLPAAEIAKAARRLGARAVVLGLVTLDGGDVTRQLGELGEALPEGCALWIGGPGSQGHTGEGAEVVPDLDTLEQKIQLLAS